MYHALTYLLAFTCFLSYAREANASIPIILPLFVNPVVGLVCRLNIGHAPAEVENSSLSLICS